MVSVLKEYSDDFLLFIEAGFVAVNQFDEDAAIKLFKSAEILNSGNSFSKLGMGYVHLLKLELKKAATIFEEISQKEPDNEMAKTLLGLSLSLQPQELVKGEKTLQEITALSKDSQMKTLADTALSFVHKFVKKNPTPVQGKK